MAPTTPSSAAANQSVERGAAVLRAFLEAGSGRTELRVSDVARAIGLGQSTTSRLLATLESVEFVERDPVSQLYRLGPALITFGSAALNQHPVHRESRQVAQNLAAELGLGANVAIRRGASLFYLCNFEGRRAPKSFVQAGRKNPLHATGLGKCLLLGSTLDQRKELLGPELPTYTKHTIGDHQKLDTELEAATVRGYATEVEELALGRACVATPIRDASGDVVAAMSVSGPLTALNLEAREGELAATLIEAADSVSIALGYTASHPDGVAV
ncbi:IclR family transcriptional regulator [Tenggerimyces flavus]|uniref:IclR family transcriptional regulator n=1 Tax=Tenggerimyces flavus TaxID=1708749 RepID=A0ABV7Y5C1_9ACTN|nr:IclR family transcriptional regulator [Tenggerimyces flavus]MBM7791055.1 DNA-binding IclR family transcriptional regulator [Tenggerimyces flavus]